MTTTLELGEAAAVDAAGRWVHYTNAENLEIESRQQAADARGDKPRGFWVSDEHAEQSWSAWCAAEEFTRGSLAYDVDLSAKANLLRLTTPAELVAFHHQFTKDDLRRHGWSIDWLAVAERWQGIVITPYQWSLRLSSLVSWYYTWDCASGCIWDASAIESVTLR